MVNIKNILFLLWEIGKIIFIALLIVIPIRYFVFQPFIVRGISMEPNFQHNDYLIVDQLSYRFRKPQRGEVIIFSCPAERDRWYIKRIIALPRETIKIKAGQVIIMLDQQENKLLDETNFLPLNIQTPGNIKKTLTKNEFFVLGDNRIASFDSRQFGPLHRKHIVGRAFLRVWPFTIFEIPEISKITLGNYE